MTGRHSAVLVGVLLVCCALAAVVWPPQQPDLPCKRRTPLPHPHQPPHRTLLWPHSKQAQRHCGAPAAGVEGARSARFLGRALVGRTCGGGPQTLGPAGERGRRKLMCGKEASQTRGIELQLLHQHSQHARQQHLGGVHTNALLPPTTIAPTLPSGAAGRAISRALRPHAATAVSRRTCR